MSVLWTSADAARATDGTATAPFEATGLSIDTRSISPGDMFIALTDVRDGHDFVANAFAAGASAALVTHRPEGVAEDAPLLIVPDVLAALNAMARAARARTKASVIGVTGSVGKTSTKDMLRHVLDFQGQVHAAEKSFNNHWGVPLTLARCPADADFAVIEIGMNHPGEIAPLAKLADLDAAVITTVAAVHLEAFDDIEGIAREKAAIFEGLRWGGGAVINGDIETFPILLDGAQTYGAMTRVFGSAVSATERLLDTRLTAAGIEADILLDERKLTMRLRTAGLHFAMNALAALAAIDAIGADPARAARDMNTWTPPSGRGTRETVTLPQGRITLIDDAYNANPTSMAAALDVLAATVPESAGRRVAVLGDMLELGPTEAALHADLAELPVMESIDRVFCVGPRMESLYGALPDHRRAGQFPDAASAVASIPARLAPGDVIMIKGSLGSHVSKLVTALRQQSEEGS